MLAGAALDQRVFESVLIASLLIVEYRLDHRRIGENLRAKFAYIEACIRASLMVLVSRGRHNQFCQLLGGPND